MNQERIFQILRLPHISEKAAILGDTANQAVFKVASDANKGEIKAAVEQLFNVKVADVRTVNMKGKRPRSNVSSTTRTAVRISRCCSTPTVSVVTSSPRTRSLSAIS